MPQDVQRDVRIIPYVQLQHLVYQQTANKLGGRYTDTPHAGKKDDGIGQGSQLVQHKAAKAAEDKHGHVTVPAP